MVFSNWCGFIAVLYWDVSVETLIPEAHVVDSWNRKRWTQSICSLGLSYESRVNRLGGVASSVSIGQPN